MKAIQNAKQRPQASTTVRSLFTGVRWLSHLSPDAAGAIALYFFTKPRHFTRPEWERELLRDATPFALTAKVQAWSWGANGPVVALVHGWEGRGSQLASFAGPLVAAGFRVITFDAKGHGDSAGSHTTLLDFVEALEAVQRMHPLHGVVAHSFGGAALALALQRGLTTNAATLLCPPASLDAAPRHFAAATGVGPLATRELKRGLERRLETRFKQLRVQHYGPSMTTPLLLVQDDDDRDVSPADADRYVAAWPNTRLVRTRGLGHRKVLRAQPVISQVVDFLKSVAPHQPSELERWFQLNSSI